MEGVEWQIAPHWELWFEGYFPTETGLRIWRSFCLSEPSYFHKTFLTNSKFIIFNFLWT
jgi:hypothetical protein